MPDDPENEAPENGGPENGDDETPPGALSVHVFLNDTVAGAGFDDTVSRLVDAAVRDGGGGAAVVGGRFPLAKSFALEAEPRVIDALQGLDAVKSVTSGAGDFLPPPASRRVID